MTFDPPGYEPLALLGFGGASGEVWRARERASGELVVLARPEGLDPAALERVALLRGPHLVRLRAVLAGDPPVLVLDHVGGGSLAALVARRGRLHPGEVVTVAAPLAGALAQVHAAGLVHGALRASSVLLTPAGMPVLADAGLAGPGSPQEDVRALARLCADLLTGGPVPRPLQAVLEAVLVPGDGPVPDAAAFGLALRRAQAAVPVRLAAEPGELRGTALPGTALPGTALPGTALPDTALPGPLPGGRHRAPGLPRPPRALLVTVAALIGLVLAAGAGWSLGGRGSSAGARLPPAAALPAAALPAAAPSAAAPSAAALPAAAPSAAALPGAAPPAAVPWAAVLDGLDRAREAAYRAADPSALRGVHADASPALAADTALLARLAATGSSALGVRHDLLDVRQISDDGTTARLRVRDVLRAHQVLGRDGAVVQRRPRGAPRSSLVVVVRTPSGWRLAQVSAG